MQLNSRNDAAYWAKVPGLSGILDFIKSELLFIRKSLLETCRGVCVMFISVFHGKGRK